MKIYKTSYPGEIAFEDQTKPRVLMAIYNCRYKVKIYNDRRMKFCNTCFVHNDELHPVPSWWFAVI